MARLYKEVPMLKIHMGLITRNELAHEWKDNLYWISNSTSKGDGIPAEELDDEEYNELFDAKAFVYGSNKNDWDHGWPRNCWTFWCWPQWPAGEKGEF